MSERQQIIDLEKRFWDTMVSKDAETATAMMAKESIVIGPQGISKITRGDFANMMAASTWTLDEYHFSDVHVIFPTDTSAVIGYKVKQKGTMDGKPYSLEAVDASTWSRADGEWLCVLHTETTIGRA